MDIAMPDANQLDEADHVDQPNQHDQADDPAPPEPDPNNLFKCDIKVHDSTTLVILDATETEPADGYEENDSVHQKACRLMETTFREITNFEIVKICLEQGATEADFVQAIDDLLAQKTKKDLLIFHYHGSAGGVDENYKWRFQRGPHGGVNAYKFIKRLCKARPDSLILPDCYIHDKIENKWKLKTGNVECFALKGKIQDGAGRLIHADEGYLTQAVCRNLRGWLDDLLDCDFFTVAGRKPQTVPNMYAKDYVMKSCTTRIRFSRTRKGSKQLCLRIKANPMRCWQAGKIILDSYCLGPARPPPVEILPPEDEGFAEMEAGNGDYGDELFVQPGEQL